MSVADPIRHVVLLMLENRSFDQMLGDLKSENADIDGIDRVHPGTNIDPKTNTPIAQQPIASYTLPDKVDIGHEPDNVDAQLDLKGTPMSGFVGDFRNSNSAGNDDGLAQQVMAYYPVGVGPAADKLPALHALARNFTVCDRWFSSLPGPTWPNRLFALTGTSAGWRSMPSGLHIGGPPLVYGQETIFNRFADKGLTARSYCAGKSITWIMRQTWLHPSWRRGMDDFDNDVAGPEVNFPAFAFIEPNYFGKVPDDQHPPHDVRRGEQLIADVYNKIRANQALWESTLLVVVYDEHGGFYDHVAPPKTIAPDGDNQEHFDFTQLGVRVPAVLVSPWLPQGVSHTQFDHTSVLRYLCDKWGLERLGKREQGANSISQAFSGLPNLRTDTPSTLTWPKGMAAAAGASSVVNSNQVALAKSIDAMHAELGFSAPPTRALAPPLRDPQALCKRAFARADATEEMLAREENKRLVKVLAVHGVGHGDQDTGWRDEWRNAIVKQVRAQPGTADWNVEVEFAVYDDLFETRPLGAKQIGEALLRLAGGLISGPNETARRGLLGSLGKVEDKLRWSAGMIVQWVDDPRLRAQLRERVAQHVQDFDPDLIAAHSLGSLVAYDLFRRDIAAGNGAQHAKRYLLTFGSQIANPAVLPVFDGRIEPLHDAAGAGFRQWFHLFNTHDLVFTARLPIKNDPRTSNLEADFNGLTNGSHDVLSHNGESYLSNPGGTPAWSALTVDGKDVARALGVALKSTSVADTAPAVVRTDTQSKQRALLVGINEYPDPRNRLQGCVNDVFLVSSVLQELGFAADDIRIVLDDRATRAGIEERMEWLMDDVKKGDTRVFFYSGHGAQIPTYSEHATPDGMEESLVPYDFDWSEAHAFTDSNFRKYYAQLPYDAHFFAAFDCCHAGGMARGSLRPRGLDPPDDIRHRMLEWSAQDQMWVPRGWLKKHKKDRPNRLFASRSLPSSNTSMQALGQAGEIRTTGDDKKVQKDYDHHGPYMPLMMFACGEGQLASEYEHGAISYGAFSYVFAKTLREQKSRKKNATLKQLVSLSAAELKYLGYDQTPEMVGPAKKYKAGTLVATLLG
jgi:hypothetical protein